MRRNLLFAAGLGLAISLVLGLLADARAVAASLAAFDASVLPLVIGLTALNYALRWAKWHGYLHQLAMAEGIAVLDSILIFAGGMIMAVTPAKVGEVLKSALLKRLNGTAVSASAPIVVAERVTDGIAMLLLMSVGLTLYEPARPAFIALVLLTIIGLVLIQWRRAVAWGLARLAALPVAQRSATRLAAAYDSTRALLGWRALFGATIVSVVSWFGECLAFAFVLVGLGVPLDARLVIVATFVFAASTLFGLVSFLPGGLGVSEASSAGLLVLLVPLAGGPAAAATIIIRFATLWFGVALGALALLWFRRRHGAHADEHA